MASGENADKKGRVLSTPPMGEEAFRRSIKRFFSRYARQDPSTAFLFVYRSKGGRKRILDWAKRFSGEGFETLWNLYHKRSIPPAPVLRYFANIKARDLMYPDAEAIRKYLGNLKGRKRLVEKLRNAIKLTEALSGALPTQPGYATRRVSNYLRDFSLALKNQNEVEAKKLSRAREIVEKRLYHSHPHPIDIERCVYCNLEIIYQDQQASDTVQHLSFLIRRIGEKAPPESGRPAELLLKAMASYIAAYFREITGKSLPQYVGKLIKIAFPEKWNPAGKIEDATRKLLAVSKAQKRFRREV